MERRFWTNRECAFATEHKGKLTAAQIAKRLHRSSKSVEMFFFVRGLTAKRVNRGERFVRFILVRHAKGWSDAEIAAEWNARRPKQRCSRERLSEVRRDKLGLSHNAYSEHRRKKVAARTREQLREAGLVSIGHLRREAFARWCKDQGWPQLTRPRAAQIMNVLYERGPRTRKQIAAAIGMPWKGSRKSLVSNDPGGSYLAYLARIGLVVRLPKLNKGRGKGTSTNLYAVSPHVRRNRG